MEQLIYSKSPRVTFATNEFVNVPVILQFDDIPLISVVRQQDLSYTTEIPIYHADGTYLAVVKGTRIFATEAGKKAGLEMRYPKGMTVCELAGKPAFEIFHASGDAFRAHAELHTPNGCFVRSHDKPFSDVMAATGKPLQLNGMVIGHNSFNGFRIGVWVKSDGSVAIGCN